LHDFPELYSVGKISWAKENTMGWKKMIVWLITIVAFLAVAIFIVWKISDKADANKAELKGLATKTRKELKGLATKTRKELKGLATKTRKELKGLATKTRAKVSSTG